MDLGDTASTVQYQKEALVICWENESSMKTQQSTLI